jgi:hypothetical protein
MTSGAWPRGPHLDDEQLSSMIDGLAGPEAREHAARCPECAARVAHWHRAHDLVAAPPAGAGADRRDSAVQAGLAAFEEERSRPLPVVGSGTARRHLPARSRRPARRAAVATAAAALLAVAGLGIALSQSGDHHRQSHESAAGSTTAPASSNVPGSGAPSAAPLFPAETVAPLGSFPDMAALIPVVRSRIREQLAAPSAAASGSPTAPGCQTAAAAAAETSTLPVLHGTLTYAGTPADVYAYPRPASTVVVVVSTGSCVILAKGSF